MFFTLHLVLFFALAATDISVMLCNVVANLVLGIAYPKLQLHYKLQKLQGDQKVSLHLMITVQKHTKIF
jgi:hypothetical protein